jgi:hypothetical protein
MMLAAFLTGCRKTVALAATALESFSKCSVLAHKLRFFVGFRLVLPVLTTFFNTLPTGG